MSPVKEQKLKYTRRLLVTDFTLVVLSIVAAAVINFRDLVNTFTETEQQGLLRIQLNPAALAWSMGIIWLLSLKFNGSRDDRIIGTGSDEYKRIFSSSITLLSLLALAALFLKLDVSRLFVAFSLLIGTVSLTLGRWVWRQWLRNKRANNQLKERVAIAGPASLIEELAEKLLNDKQGAYTPALLVPLSGKLSSKIKHQTNFGDPAKTLKDHKLDALIVVGTDTMSSKHLKQISWNMEKSNATLIVAPGLLEAAGPRVHTRPVSGMPLIEIEPPKFTGGKYIVKQVLDIVLAITALIVASPVMLITAFAVKTDGGPILFLQERHGKDGKIFKMIKFRSMKVGSERLHEELKQKNQNQLVNTNMFKDPSDPRITKVGKFIRKYSIDELPQIFNVLKGEMSLVGPRPPLPSEVKEYEMHVHRRLYVKPGITGIWQVSGRSALSWEETVLLDLRYVEDWSIFSDILIIAKTIFVVFSKSGAF
jgi:exopolysaccharide biosynthesis polyprenyl glycosylphosphotransferase